LHPGDSVGRVVTVLGPPIKDIVLREKGFSSQFRARMFRYEIRWYERADTGYRREQYSELYFDRQNRLKEKNIVGYLPPPYGSVTDPLARRLELIRATRFHALQPFSEIVTKIGPPDEDILVTPVPGEYRPARRLIYVIRRYADGPAADRYEQVFAVDLDKGNTVIGRPEFIERPLVRE